MTTVFFDAIGTLIGFRQSYAHLVAQACARFGAHVSVSRIEEGLRRPGGRLRDVIADAGFDSPPTFTPEQSTLLWGRLHARLLQHLGVGDVVPADALYRVVSDPTSYVAFPDTAPVLVALRQRGFHVGLISNFEDTLPTILEVLRVRSLFDTMVISGVDGVAKPSREAFVLAAERAGAAVKSCVHVGDSVDDDVAGAERAGMRGLFIDRTGHALVPAGLAPPARSLLEILQRLDGPV